MDETLPKISPAEQDLVDAWWTDVKPFYRRRDADLMLQRVRQFLETRPDLLPYLYLHEEFLFELGAELGRRRRWLEYVELLQRLRREQPRVYSFSFGYFDRDIIYELAIDGRVEEIASYLSFFKQYPDSQPDNCSAIIDFLAWRGLAEPLYELAQAVAVPMLTSRNVIGGGFAMDWLIYREHFRWLEVRDSSLAAAEQIVQNLQLLSVEIPWRLDREIIGRDLGMALAPPGALELDQVKPRPERWLSDLLWNFTGQLHERRGVPWVQARFLANRMDAYINWCARHDHDAFRFRERELETHLARACRDFICLDGVLSLSLLQAVAWFAEYLSENGAIPDAERQEILTICERLFDKARKNVDSTDPGYRLIPTFDRLIAHGNTPSPSTREP